MPARRRGGVLARPTLSILSAVALVTCIAVVVVRRSSVSSLTRARSESDDTEEQYEDAAGGVPLSELPQHGTADAVEKVHVGGQTHASSKEEVEVDGRTVRVRPHPMDEGSRADLTVAKARRRWKDAPVLEKHNSTLSCAATAAATVAWRRMTPEKMFEPDPHSSPRALKDAQERAGATPAKKPRFHASCAVRLPTM